MRTTKAKKFGLASVFGTLAGLSVLTLEAFTRPVPAPVSLIQPWEEGLYVEAAQEIAAVEQKVEASAIDRLRQGGIDADALVGDLLNAGVSAHAVLASSLTVGELSDEDAKERACLSQAIYYEARNQEVMGQLAVADVVLNRVADKRFPNTICGVVFQGVKSRRGCQFSFACDGSMKKAREPRSWKAAEHLGDLVFRGFRPPLTQFSTFYHADYVAPYWAKVFNETTVIGDHIFYRPPGALKVAASQLGVELTPEQRNS